MMKAARSDFSYLQFGSRIYEAELGNEHKTGEMLKQYGIYNTFKFKDRNSDVESTEKRPIVTTNSHRQLKCADVGDDCDIFKRYFTDHEEEIEKQEKLIT